VTKLHWCREGQRLQKRVKKERELGKNPIRKNLIKVMGCGGAEDEIKQAAMDAYSLTAKHNPDSMLIKATEL